MVKTMARPALHAFTLGFEHPSTGCMMNFEAALPADFLNCLEGLRAMGA